MSPMPDDWPTLDELSLLNGHLSVTRCGVRVVDIEEWRGFKPYHGDLTAAMLWRLKQQRRAHADLLTMWRFQRKLKAFERQLEQFASMVEPES